MHISAFENLLWGFGAALKILLCVLVVHRRVYLRLPFFAIYVVLLVAEALFVWFVYHSCGYASSAAWYAYWSALAVVLLARALVIAELCWVSLSPYPGVWSVARKILRTTAILLLVSALASAALNKQWIVGFVLATERGLEITASVILILLLAVTIQYRAWLEPMEYSLLIGLAIYSIFQTLNRGFMSLLMTPYFQWWDSVRVACFNLALLTWLYPLRKPLPTRSLAPPLLREEIAADTLRRVLEGMRELRNELKQLRRAVWK